MKLLLLLVLAAVVSEVVSRRAGPPISSFRTRICNEMLPSHGSNSARSGNGGYTITTNIPRSVSSGYSYTAGQTYTVTLSGSNSFLGFLVIAHIPGQNNMLLGAFTAQNSNQQILDCDDVGTAPTATVAHSNNARTQFPSMTFTWRAPSGADGTVDFRYTVVRSYGEFYVLQSAASNDPFPQATTAPPTLPPGQTTTAAIVPMDTTTAQTNPTVPEDPTTTTPPSSGGATAPMRAPGDYRFTFQNPPGCSPASCDVFVGIDTNAGDSNYLDIYLEGEADGWVAVGFSSSPSMSLADVVACNRNPSTNMVEALDAWNVQGYGNNVDAVQDVQQFSGTYSGGRIRCSAAKRIASGRNQDLDLDNNYYILFGRRRSASVAGALIPHEQGPTNNPRISTTTINPVDPFGRTTDDTDSTTISGLTAPITAPEDYQLILRNPPDCVLSQSECDVFVGIGTNAGNSDFLDIYLEGEADGWVAVGFSATSNMNLADVVACNRNPATNMVEALDAWNIQHYGNNIDAVQDVQQFSGSYSSGRITCSVAKRIVPSTSGIDEDLNLDNNYYILFGRRRSASVAGALIPHEQGPTNNPRISTTTINPVDPFGRTTDDTDSTTISSLTAPVTAPEDYRLILRNPPDCVLSQSECDVFVGISTNSGNSDFLDIYLEGEADGWVAVGFSATSNMNLADVVACNRNPATNMVEALDAWNIQRYGNDIDAVQDVQQFSGNYSSGRITCSVAKRIVPSTSGTDEDLNLDNNYYILFGRRRGASGAGALFPHEQGPTNNPSISSATVNPVTAGGSVGAQTFPILQLLRFHGILMIIAWPLLALCGIFFASWMRPALPNGEWFQVHRAFLLASMFIGAVGFAVAFIANYSSSTSGLITLGASNTAGTAHFAIGIIVMLLHILNPIIAAFRCKPTGKYRWIFNLLHGTFIGVLAEMAALTNVSLGTYLLFRRYTPLFWVFIAYLVLNLVVFLVLLLLHTLTSCLSNDPNRKNLAPSLIKPLILSPELSEEKVQMSHLDPDSPKTQEREEKADDTEEDKPKKKAPSKDSPIRWASFIAYMVLSTPLMVALIGLAAGLQP